MENDSEKQQEQVEPSAYCRAFNHFEDQLKIEEYHHFFPEELKGVGVHSVKINYNNKYVAGGYRDGIVRVFNLLTANDKPVFELDCNDGSESKTLVQVMRWRPHIEGRTNNILMAACRDTIFEFHVTSKSLIYKKTFPDNTIFSMDCSNDGLDYALGFKDSSIRVYDGIEKKEKYKLGGHDNYKVQAHNSKIYAIKYHKDNPKILLSGGWDGNVFVWDLNTEMPITSLNGPMISGEGLDMNDFGEVLTASWRRDSPLQLWNLNSEPCEPKDIEWNLNPEEGKMSTQLYCCKFSNDFGKLIFAGGSQVNAVKIFDWQGNYLSVIDNLSHAVVSLDCSNNANDNNHFLCIGGGEGAIRVFKNAYLKDKK